MRSLIGGIRARAAGTVAGVVAAALLGGGLLGPPGAAAAASAASPPADPTSLVHPFVGTENFGNTFPGASAPFGMVQVSPDTGGQGGYDYDQNAIHGFSQTHLSGVGCGVAGELPIMPTTGAVSDVDPDHYRSTYSHDDEEATPGYYRVGLKSYGIDAELTATQRTGWQRYTFPATGAANVLFNTGKANQKVFGSEIRVVGDRTVEGRVEAGNFCAGKDRHTVYFTATFDRPFASYGTWRGTTPTPGSREAAGEGGNGAWATFDATEDRDVVVKVGLSYTGPRAPARTSRRRPGTPTTSTPPAPRSTTPGGRSSTRSGSAAAPRSGSAPSTPRCTTPSCTPMWRATWTAATPASTARPTPPPATPRTRTSRCGTPTGRRTSCWRWWSRGWPAMSRCRWSPSAGTAAGCRAGRWPTARPTS
ncbi:hypothetical protein SVIO_094270 [Streptomyces violaceusniger]|uniref:Glycosyl hydrolase family 92 N-terminal domain-containing protein n=1 Tax=Streptomyces violaceusniger TaxID=68280 RepID=A0A4D4LEP4_STRVO|nr:hypothetical protein SVIO_094270 [Streptomyces violaceusniger]